MPACPPPEPDPPQPNAVELAPGVRVPEAALRFTFSRSGGPGGQNVNKVNSRATLTVRLADLAPALPNAALHRLQRLAGQKLAGRPPEDSIHEPPNPDRSNPHPPPSSPPSEAARTTPSSDPDATPTPTPRSDDPLRLVITSDQSRSQEANKRDCLDRLRDLLVRALARPKRRIPTKPSRAARQRRLDAKKQRGQIKQNRGRVDR